MLKWTEMWRRSKEVESSLALLLFLNELFCISLTQAGKVGIIRELQNQTVLLGGESAVFNCTVQICSTCNLGWKINDRDVLYPEQLREDGIEFHSQPLDVASLSLLANVTASESNNGTKLQCYVYGNGVALSKPAWLTVVGKPLPPHPILETLNSGNTLQVSWEKPFTIEGVADIWSYHLTVMTSDSALLVDETINAPQDTTLFKYNFSRNDLRGTECEEFVFGVTATNAVGESERGITTGGFPIDIENLSTGASILSIISIPEQNEVEIVVKPPHMCSYQEAVYIFILFDQTGDKISTFGPVTHQYGKGDPFTITMKGTGMSGTKYQLEMSVDSMMAEKPTAQYSMEVQCCNKSSTNITHSKSFIDQHFIMIVSVGSGVMVVITCLVVSSVLLVVHRRLRKSKARVTKAVPHYPVNMVDNPIYEEAAPIYEEIPGCSENNKPMDITGDRPRNLATIACAEMNIFVSDQSRHIDNCSQHYAKPPGSSHSLVPSEDTTYIVMQPKLQQ